MHKQGFILLSLLFFLIQGCGENPPEEIGELAVLPNPFYKAKLQEAGKVHISGPKPSQSAYRNETNFATAEGNVGQFGFVIQNRGPKLDFVSLVVTVQDPSLFLEWIPIRIANVLYVQYNFAEQAVAGPPTQSTGQPFYSEVLYPGTLLFQGIGPFEKDESRAFEMILIGQPGLAVHLEAVGVYDSTGKEIISSTELSASFLLQYASIEADPSLVENEIYENADFADEKRFKTLKDSRQPVFLDKLTRSPPSIRK